MTKMTASQLAKLLKLNVETVRKRAKAGAIPATKNSNNQWEFDAQVLAAAGIIGPQGAQAPAAKAAAKRRTHVFFVIDGSGSMDGLHSRVRDNLKAQVGELAKAEGPHDEFLVTALTFDTNVRTTALRMTPGQALHGTLYSPHGGYTALYDAVLEAIRLGENSRIGAQEDAVLISVVTDGGENSSRAKDFTVQQAVAAARATDHFTFAYAGPPGSNATAIRMGFAAGNVTTWEGTAEGLAFLTNMQTNSMASFVTARSTGQTYSTSYYAQPTIADPAKFANQLGKVVPALPSDRFQVERVSPGDPIAIKAFLEKKLGKFEKGKAFYELTASEKVQDYKELIVQDTKTGTFYAGQRKALGLLGIPNFTGTVRIRPGNLGEFKVFVQSTSVNRKLEPNTAVVVLK